MAYLGTGLTMHALGPILHGIVLRGIGVGRALVGEQCVEKDDVAFEQVDAPEVANDAMAVPGATIGQALAIRFLQSKVLARAAVGGADGDLRRYTGNSNESSPL